MKLTTYWKNLEPKQRFATLLFACYAAVFPLAQLGRQYMGDVVFYLSDLFILVWLVVYFRALLAFATRLFSWMKAHPLSWFVAFWVLGTLLVGSLAAEQLRPLLVSLRIVMYFMFAGSVGIIFARQPYFVRCMLLMSGVLIAWFGLLQYLFLPDTRFLFNLGWDDHYYRLLGTFFDPNFAGMALVLALLVTLSLHARFSRYIVAALTVLFSAGIALTFSRSTYAAYAVALLLILVLPPVLSSWKIGEKILVIVLAAATFGTVLFLAPKPGGEGVKLLRTASITARADATSTYITNLSQWSIYFGTGLFVQPTETAATPAPEVDQDDQPEDLSVFLTADTAPEVPNHSQVPDNIIVTLLSGIGIIGTIAAVALMLIFIHDVAKREMLGAIALGSTLIHAQFNNTFFEPFIFQYLMLIVLVPLPFVITLDRGFRSKKKTKMH